MLRVAMSSTGRLLEQSIQSRTELIGQIRSRQTNGCGCLEKS